MKRKFTFLFLLMMLIAASSSAQLKGFSVGPYFEAAWPKGDMAEVNKRGLGIGVAADVKLGGRLAATGSIGYIRFGKTSMNANAPSNVINATPIRAGFKYKLPIVYLKLEGGVARFSNGNESPIIVSPGVGFRLLGLDIQGSYETWFGDNGRSFTSLKIGYHF
jgi:hypothetical protein